MNKLGRGWQYTAYDLGNGRVLKRRNTRIEAYAVMFKSTLPFPPIWKFPKFYRSAQREAISSLRKVQETSLDKKLFANPTFLPDEVNYEQDKVLSLQDYFKYCSFEEGKKAIDKFIGFTKFLLEQRYIDKSFAIGKNFGLDKDGEVVMFDIGEIWSSPENIQKQIKNRVWTYNYVVKVFPNKELKEYFIKEMDKNLLNYSNQ